MTIVHSNPEVCYQGFPRMTKGIVRYMYLFCNDPTEEERTGLAALLVLSYTAVMVICMYLELPWIGL